MNPDIAALDRRKTDRRKLFDIKSRPSSFKTRSSKEIKLDRSNTKVNQINQVRKEIPQRYSITTVMTAPKVCFQLRTKNGIGAL